MRVRIADGAAQRIGTAGAQHMPGEEAWLVDEHRSNGERKYYLSNLPADTTIKGVAGAIKARWICERAHRQLKEELGLDHFEGRSWTGLHRHLLMIMMAYAFLQTRRLAQVRRKKESPDLRLSRACPPSDRPSLTEYRDLRHANALTAERAYGTTSDAAQITAPEQATIEVAIAAALADAKVDPAESLLISAHGTGTPLNDRCEAASLHAVLNEQMNRTTVIATKSIHGHLIGASGALQFILGLKAIAEGTAPPVLNYLGQDAECMLPLALEPTSIDCDVLVSNSFAFGGLNAVLVARRA